MLRHPILRGLHRDVGWSWAHDAAHVSLSLTSFLLLQRALAPAEYGIYFGIYGLVGIFSALTISGITFAALQRLVAEPDEAGDVLQSFLSLVILVGLAAAVVAGLVSTWSLRLGVVEIATIVVAELVCAGVIAVSAVLVHAHAGFPAAVRVRLPVIGLRATVLVVLAATDRLDIRNLAVGNLIALSLYAAFLLTVHLPRHGYVVSLGVPETRAARSSAAFAVPAGASQLQSDGDKYLLNVFGHEADGGLYGAAYRIVQLATLPLQAVETAVFHRFLPSDPTRGEHTGRARAFLVFMSGASAVAVIALVVVLPFADVLLDPSYDEALDIVPWLLPLIPLAAIRSIPLNAMLGLGRADVRMMIYAASAAVTLGCYLALIPSLSWRGAVIATLVGECFLVVTGWSMLRRLQRRADAALSTSTG